MTRLEEYGNGVEIERKVFTVLLRLNDEDGRPTNQYIITRDGQEIQRFITSNEKEAKSLFGKITKNLD